MGITGRDAAGLELARNCRGGNALAIRSDAGGASAAKSLAAAIAASNTRLDAVFVSAGIGKFAAFAEVDEALSDQAFHVNIKGAHPRIRALLPLLRPDASIVINGSINAHIRMSNTSVHAAGKASGIALAKNLLAEILPPGVRINLFSPGQVSTPICDTLGLNAAALGATATAIFEQIPLGRLGQQEEISSTVPHLAAPESACIVGSGIFADVGMSWL